VRRAQVLGLLGNTGDSFVPHLHFEVTNSPKLLSGEGVPYVFDSFFAGNGSTAVMHRKELPMEKMVVEFNH
jgi:murein DD-endopeptidase MepM/ murein hydrolase activator NlpD